MRIPARPPNYQELGERLIARNDSARFLRLFQHRKIVDAKGRYLHWDELRRKVTDDDLSPEETWFATRTSRMAAAQIVPLSAPNGQPFTYCEPPVLRATLRFVDLNAGGHLGTDKDGLTPSDGSKYFTRSLAEEPFASSFIEGAATTRQRAKQLIFDQRPARTRDELMVLNNYYGMEYVKTIVAEPLTVSAILETHRIITKDTLDDLADAGRLRQSDDVQVVDETTNEILHQPPPHGQLTDRLQRLCDFANATSDAPENFMHPIIRAIILHFMLAYEHPFADGNGRTARALFYWSALKSGYWLIEYVSISSVIAEAKIAYGQAFLKTETDANDLTYFLLHQARVLRTAIERLMSYAERRKKEVGAFQAAIDDGGEFNRRQSMLLNDVARQRINSVTIAEHEKRHKVSRLTARSDLEELVAMGLLRKRKKGRQNFYSAVPDVVSRLSTRSG